MSKQRRTAVDKLRTLLFGKDLRITKGEPCTQVREFDFSSYYPEDKYISFQEKPEENVFDIRNYGAVAGDPTVDNSRAINSAVIDAAKCGGTVLIDGGEYFSSTVVLKSGITLFISEFSSLTAVPSGKNFKNKALVYGEGIENVTITGGGSINGSGHLFGLKPLMDKNMTEPDKYIDVIEMRRDYRAQLRFAHSSKYGGPLCLVECKNVNLSNFKIVNSAYWTCRLQMCSNVYVKNVIINNNRNVANADGFDVVGGSNLDFDHCFVSTADDGFVFKHAVWLGSSGIMEHIAVKNCEVISRTNAVKIGTETTYDINDITVSDCRLFMNDLYPGSVSGISIEACDGSVVSNVTFRNIEMERCTCPIFIRVGDRNRAAEVTAESANAVEYGGKKKKGGTVGADLFGGKSRINGVLIENVKALEAELPIIIAGYRKGGKTVRAENIALKNIDITYAERPETVDRRLFIPEYAKVYPECWRFRNLPAYGVWARHVSALTIENVKINHPLDTWKKEKIFIDCTVDEK